MDYDMGNKDDFVGSTSFKLSSISIDGGFDDWWKIQFEGKLAGTVHLKGECKKGKEWKKFRYLILLKSINKYIYSHTNPFFFNNYISLLFFMCGRIHASCRQHLANQEEWWMKKMTGAKPKKMIAGEHKQTWEISRI